MLQTIPVLLCVLAISAGQILFKLAAERLDATDSRALFVTLLLNPPLLAAVALYGATTVGWVWLLKDRPLSEASPFFALSFVFVAVMGRVFLGETLGLPVIAGTALVVSGVALITAFR